MKRGREEITVERSKSIRKKQKKGETYCWANSRYCTPKKCLEDLIIYGEIGGDNEAKIYQGNFNR